MTKEKLSLFNHEKRIKVLEAPVKAEEVHWFDAFIRFWGPPLGFCAFIICIVFLICPSLLK